MRPYFYNFLSFPSKLSYTYNTTQWYQLQYACYKKIFSMRHKKCAPCDSDSASERHICSDIHQWGNFHVLNCVFLNYT